MNNTQNLDVDFLPDKEDGYSDLSYVQSPFESQEDYEERMENLESFLEHLS